MATTIKLTLFLFNWEKIQYEQKTYKNYNEAYLLISNLKIINNWLKNCNFWKKKIIDLKKISKYTWVLKVVFN